MAKMGAVFLRTDTELVFKSRYVVPGRLLGAGFAVRFPGVAAAAADLVARWREAHLKSRADAMSGAIRQARTSHFWPSRLSR
jgi:hypothetical protein